MKKLGFAGSPVWMGIKGEKGVVVRSVTSAGRVHAPCMLSLGKTTEKWVGTEKEKLDSLLSHKTSSVPF
jgi:hypothetical protein